MRRVQVRLLFALAWLAAIMPAGAGELDQNWAALASDRSARAVGDVVTVVVYQTSQAADSATTQSSRASNIHGQVAGGPSFNESGHLDLASGSDNTGQTNRSGTMIAQISAVVGEVYPNGDFQIAGSQVLNIDGEKTTIRVKGRVRQKDISAENAVLSTRLADAVIDYDGSGFVSRSAHPGLITRALNWLGLP